MPGLFESQRLVYEALEDTQADRDFMYTAFLDPTTVNPGSVGIPRPSSRQRSDEYVQGVTKRSLLAVKICLRPSSSSPSSSTAAASTTVGFLTMKKFDADRDATLQTTCGPLFIAAEHRRQGYAAEAMNWALDWAFGHARVHRLALETNADNHAANALYRGLGFVEEGRRRHAHFFAGRWVDIVMFSMLEDEWRALRAAEAGGPMSH